MRILMLAHRMPYPPSTGDKVRAYHVARHLAREHRLTLAFPIDEPGADAALAALRAEIPDLEHAPIARRPKRVGALLRLACGGSATMAYYHCPALAARVADRLGRESFDLTYFSSSSMSRYAADARLPVLMDFVDVDSDKWLQYGARRRPPAAWVYRLEGLRLRRYEAAAARRATHCLVATRLERILLRTFAPWAPVTVVPNGVDLDYFRPAPTPVTAPTVAFTGAMDYFPNVDAVTYFCERIFPRIRAAAPEARFLIVGKNPTPAVRRLGRTPGVEVTGSVPDVRPFLRRAAVAVAPLRIARGVQNKVLEAMACGLAVVATSPAHQALDARPSRDLFVEDDPAAFADAVTNLLRTPALRAAVGAAARRFVQAHHSWSAAMAPLDGVLAEIGRPHTAAAPSR